MKSSANTDPVIISVYVESPSSSSSGKPNRPTIKIKPNSSPRSPRIPRTGGYDRRAQLLAYAREMRTDGGSPPASQRTEPKKSRWSAQAGPKKLRVCLDRILQRQNKSRRYERLGSDEEEEEEERSASPECIKQRKYLNIKSRLVPALQWRLFQRWQQREVVAIVLLELLHLQIDVEGEIPGSLELVQELTDQLRRLIFQALLAASPEIKLIAVTSFGLGIVRVIAGARQDLEGFKLRLFGKTKMLPAITRTTPSPKLVTAYEFDFQRSSEKCLEDLLSKLIGQFLHKQRASEDFLLNIDREMQEHKQDDGDDFTPLPPLEESPLKSRNEA